MVSAKVRELIDFEMIGLVSTSKPHKLAWIVSSCCNLDLEKTDLELTSKEGIIFNPICYFSESDYTSFYLIANKVLQADGYKNYLINALKSFDYFLIIKDQTQHALEETTSNLKDCQCITYHTKLIPDHISGIEAFIF
jgi:hypothetical protein